jgi:predicted nucleic acid-binding Zn ribbon protein
MKDHQTNSTNKAPDRAKRATLFAVIVGCLIVLAVILTLFLIHSLGGL